MPVHYSLPGAELYLMKPGLPGAFKEPVIKGSDQSFIIDNFGQTVNQSVGTGQVNINLRVIEWHLPQNIRCHYELLPGMYTRVLVEKRIFEKIRGVGEVDLLPGEFFSLIGSSFTTMMLPEESGVYVSIGLWWSAGFIKDVMADHPALQEEMNSIISGYPRRMLAPPMALTGEMLATLEELLHFDYAQPGANKFLHERMKKLARMVVKESTELNVIKGGFSRIAWEKILQGKAILEAAPMKYITVEELGTQLEISATTLKRGIKAITLQRFQQYRKTMVFIELGRKILQDDELIKNISKLAGYSYTGDFSKEFKVLFWCTPSEFGIEKLGLKTNTSYVMSREDKFKYGSIIARYMSERETIQDLEELNKWLPLHDNHLQLFSHLLDDTKTAWTKQWFDDAGIRHNKIRWTKDGGWYRYDLSRGEQIRFYLFAALTAVLCLLYYYFELS